MDNKRLNYLKQLFDEYVNDEKAAGAAAVVFKDGKEVYFSESGYANRENEIKMSRDTIFRCFSMTKPITSVAALILMERGVIDLFDPVSKYIPEFAVENMKVVSEKGIVPSRVPMLLHHLINMTAGTPYPDPNTLSGTLTAKRFDEIKKEQSEGKYTDTLGMCREIAKIPLAFEPGARWMYGTCADILAGVIEVASGMKYSEFLKKEIFEPLGMEDTGFYVPDEKKCRFAQVYEAVPGEDELKVFTDRVLGMEGYDKAPAFESGGAGLVSTINDYSRFAMMLANGGTLDGVKILSQYTVDFMGSNQLDENQRKYLDWDTLHGYSYGNLCRVLTEPAKSRINAGVGCFGWDGWTGNYMLVDPVEKMVIMYVIQKANGTDGSLARKMINIVYSAL